MFFTFEIANIQTGFAFSDMKKIITWIVIGLISLSVLFFLFGNRGTQQLPPHPSDQREVATSISKEQFDIYHGIFINLTELQAEYEQTYAKYGYVGFEEAKETSDIPQYGSIGRKIVSARDTIPERNTSMSQDERSLSQNLNMYATSLILLSPSEDSLEGLDVANENKIAVEGTINDIKQKYGY